MIIFRTGTVRLESTFAERLEESIELISLNPFEIYWKITLDGGILLDLAPRKQFTIQTLYRNCLVLKI